MVTGAAGDDAGVGREADAEGRPLPDGAAPSHRRPHARLQTQDLRGIRRRGPVEGATGGPARQDSGPGSHGG